MTTFFEFGRPNSKKMVIFAQKTSDLRRLPTPRRKTHTPCKDVASNQRHRNTLFLDWRRILPTLLENPHQQLALEVVILEAVPLCCSHVLNKPKKTSCQHNTILTPLYRSIPSYSIAQVQAGRHSARTNTHRCLQSVVLGRLLDIISPVIPSCTGHSRLLGRHLLLLHVVLLRHGRSRLRGHCRRLSVVDSGCCHRNEMSSRPDPAGSLARKCAATQSGAPVQGAGARFCARLQEICTLGARPSYSLKPKR